MNSMKVTYEDTCILESENGTEVPAEILNFVPKKYLSVAVNQAVKVNLHYTEKQGVYLGKMAGLEITSDGPKETVTYSDRRRG